MGNRRCKKCDLTKALDAFPLYNREQGLRRHECTECHTGRMNIHYIQNKPYRLRRAKERYAERPYANWSPEEKARVATVQQPYYARWKAMVMEFYGNRCACCGETEPAFLTIDHVNNDGAAHRREISSQSAKLYRWIIQHGYPDTFQILCRNCNWGKYLNGGTCPHQASVTEGSTTISKESTPQANGGGSARLPRFILSGR